MRGAVRNGRRSKNGWKVMAGWSVVGAKTRLWVRRWGGRQGVDGSSGNRRARLICGSRRNGPVGGCRWVLEGRDRNATEEECIIAGGGLGWGGAAAGAGAALQGRGPCQPVGAPCPQAHASRPLGGPVHAVAVHCLHLGPNLQQRGREQGPARQPRRPAGPSASHPIADMRNNVTRAAQSTPCKPPGSAGVLTCQCTWRTFQWRGRRTAPCQHTAAGGKQENGRWSVAASWPAGGCAGRLGGCCLRRQHEAPAHLLAGAGGRVAAPAAVAARLLAAAAAAWSGAGRGAGGGLEGGGERGPEYGVPRGSSLHACCLPCV